MSTILLSVLLSTVYSQTEQNEKKDLWLTLKLYPSVSGNTGWFGSNEFYTSFKQRQVLSGGLEITKQLTNNWHVETGFILTDWGFKETGQGDPPDDLNTYNEQYQFLTLPINAIYKYNIFYTGLGMNVSYFLKQNQTKNGVMTSYSTPKEGQSRKASDSWLFGVNAKAGINLKMNDRLTFRPEIYGMIGASSVELPKLWQPIGLYSFGLGLGLDYNFGPNS